MQPEASMELLMLNHYLTTLIQLWNQYDTKWLSINRVPHSIHWSIIMFVHFLYQFIAIQLLITFMAIGHSSAHSMPILYGVPLGIPRSTVEKVEPPPWKLLELFLQAAVRVPGVEPRKTDLVVEPPLWKT